MGYFVFHTGWQAVTYIIGITGCILAELYTGYPLFPGENEVEQLACVMEVLGAPPEDVIMNASRRRLFFGKFIVMLVNLWLILI